MWGKSKGKEVRIKGFGTWGVERSQKQNAILNLSNKKMEWKPKNVQQWKLRCPVFVLLYHLLKKRTRTHDGKLR